MDPNMDFSKKTNLNQAFNKPEVENIPQAPQASQVPQNPSFSVDPEAPKIVQLAMKWFKLERKEAEYALFGLVVLMIIFSLSLVFLGGGDSSSQWSDNFYIDEYGNEIAF